MENFPGFPDGIQGPELMDKMREQAEKFGAQVLLDDVTSLDLTGSVPRARPGRGEAAVRAWGVLVRDV